MAKKLFKETQRFRPWEIVILIVGFMLAVLYRIVQDLMGTHTNWLSNVLFGLVLLGGLSLAFLYIWRRRTKIWVTKKGITCQRSTWFTKKRKIRWKEIEQVELVETPTLAQWHGGNVHFGQEKYFSVCGRNGVHLTTKDGEDYFLGTRNLSGLKKAIKKGLKAEAK